VPHEPVSTKQMPRMGGSHQRADAFLLPAESAVIDPSLFWYVHDAQDTKAWAYGGAEVKVYAGIGTVRLMEHKTGILYTYCELNIEWDGSEIDSNFMFEGARTNFQNLLAGKIVFGFERLALAEIENQLKYVNKSKAAALIGLVTKYRESFGLERLTKQLDKTIAQRKRKVVRKD
jgi:hypothetical protein